MNIVLLGFGSLLVTEKFLVLDLFNKAFLNCIHQACRMVNNEYERSRMVIVYFKVLSGGTEGNHKESA